ncbi:ABC transporter substrate-binding protein [Candidatus Saccharibacteria bacterium]|nr:ABC transporter substrate-binding protein [Candidatus Saccharibacteria bacterium]MCL1962923.1 ABC transporter substrate-binding protein [Candidatus Saccharibacteria bacterium]
MGEPEKKRLPRIKFKRRDLDRRQRMLMQHIRQFLFDSWDNLRLVRRQTIGWLSLVLIIIAIFLTQTTMWSRGVQKTAPIDGGTYAEGVVDTIATFNPLYAMTSSEIAMSRLVYKPLFAYDETSNLRGVLANSWSISDDGKIYNVKLREFQKWADGKKFTADDVVFTLKLIKDAKTASPLLAVWKNTEIEKVNDLEVKFILKEPNSSFQYLMTFGILPKHILQGVSTDTIRSFVAENRTKIVGTGNFQFSRQEIPGEGESIWYFTSANSTPRIKNLAIHAYASKENMIQGFKVGETNAIIDLTTDESTELLKNGNTKLVQTPVNGGVFALFNNSNPATSDKNVRAALGLAINRSEIAAPASKEFAKPQLLETPITRGVIPSVDELTEPAFDLTAAGEKLDEAEWVLNEAGQREKDGKVLELNVVTMHNADYERVARKLVAMWQKLGIKVNLTIPEDDMVFKKNYLITRNYDVLIYQLNLGDDPDVSTYWLSTSNVETSLNFANYKSRVGDLFLANARSEINDRKRDARYTDFVKQWLGDVPAVALYRPNLYSIVRPGVESYGKASIFNSLADRFYAVDNFTALDATVYRTP